MTAQPIVHAEGLSFSYGTHRALDNVSFSVHHGEIFGLLGPNGSGKSTLNSLLATLVRPQSGRLELFGLDPWSRQVEVRRRLGVLFQSPAVDRKLTAWENLEHHGHLFGMRGAELREAIGAALEAFGVADRAHDRVEKLSGGLRRRVELAKCLLPGADLLILDEPSAGLDPLSAEAFWQVLQTVVRERGVTVVVTTHVLEEAEQCNRLGLLHRGQLLAEGSPQELKARLGGQIISMRPAASPEALCQRAIEVFGLPDARVQGGLVQATLLGPAHQQIALIMEAAGPEILEITIGQPNLRNVFAHVAGEDVSWGEQAAPAPVAAAARH